MLTIEVRHIHSLFISPKKHFIKYNPKKIGVVDAIYSTRMRLRRISFTKHQYCKCVSDATMILIIFWNLAKDSDRTDYWYGIQQHKHIASDNMGH